MQIRHGMLFVQFSMQIRHCVLFVQFSCFFFFFLFFFFFFFCFVFFFCQFFTHIVLGHFSGTKAVGVRRQLISRVHSSSYIVSPIYWNFARTSVMIGKPARQSEIILRLCFVLFCILSLVILSFVCLQHLFTEGMILKLLLIFILILYTQTLWIENIHYFSPFFFCVCLFEDYQRVLRYYVYR